MAPAHDEVTYESLVNQWKKELRSPTLTKIDPHFYSHVDARLRQLVEEYSRESAIAANTPKVMILQDELRNLTRGRDDVYDLREKKIAIAALVAARGGNPDRAAMTKGEAEVYEELVRVFKEGRRELLKRGEREMSAAAAAAATPAPAPPPAVGGPPSPPDPVARAQLPAAPAAAAANAAPEPAKKEAQLPGVAPESREADGAPPKPRSGRVLVHVLKEVAPFTASDLRTYRLAPDDVVALPPDAAKVLLARGLAEAVVEG